MAKLGIMGGTFNPIHSGHIEIARIAREAADLDEVIFLPDGEPPHKAASTLAPAVSRYNMTVLAVYTQPFFSASDMEIRRSGTTYTVDTLMQLKAEHPCDDIYYIVGADTLYQVEHWSRPHLLGQMCSLIVVPRPGSDEAALKAQAEHVEGALNIRLILAGECGPEISSTLIRERAGRGETLQGLVPQPVADYIAQHGLYGAPYHWMTQKLQRELSLHRFRHTLSVAETAVVLAARFGVNPLQAHLAGLLHDCAKGLDASDLTALIRSGGISADEYEISMPALLHAPAGEALARSQYHISDSAVLSAIRWHTTGRRNMTRLEKVIYLADMIEPERDDYPGLSDIRALAETDLDAAVRRAAARSVDYILERGKKMHPRTLELAREDTTSGLRR